MEGSLHSHHIEVAERLQFLKFFASISDDYCISKKELGVIYDLQVTKSCVESDSQEFLTWCKSSCEPSSSKTAASILDLEEVGEFFTEKIACAELDVASLAPVGLEFLQFYFISLNEKEGALQRVEKPQPSQRSGGYQGYSSSAGRWTTSYSWNNPQYSWSNQGGASTAKADDKSGSLGSVPNFTLLRLPKELKELEMLWTLVLGC